MWQESMEQGYRASASKGLSLTVFLGVVLFSTSCKEKGRQATSTGSPEVPPAPTQPSIADALPPNVRLTNLAWDAFNKGAHERAIKHAQECVDDFRGGAERRQRQLEDGNAPPPPTGAVGDQERETIFANGLLNDVATCLFIKGKSEEALGRREEAVRTFRDASRYTYARCWDPNGWFWSPAEAALDQLSTTE